MTATSDSFSTASLGSSPSVLPRSPIAQLELKDILTTIPKSCFAKNRRKAWTQVFLSIGAVAAGYGAIALAPWFLLPIAWLFTGTALTGWFVIGHDCGHRSFAQRRWVNDLVGHVMMLPLIYPFHCWRMLHDFHHRHTNKLGVDNAWDPWTTDSYVQCHPFVRGFYRLMRGWFWWIGSVAHWALMHFNWMQFEGRDRAKARLSILTVVAFAAVFFPALIATTGLWGLVKFWLMPWLFYHFWMSTFTVVHHTLPEIQFRPAEDWSAAEAQLAGTVHCDYPKWVEVLCHDINVHIPHHLSVAIPSYNLRSAHAYLLQNWQAHMITRRFDWSLMQQISERCHLYHPDKAYQSFRDARVK
ncbi:MAG: fatty acid desaturase [Kaiparowitsia implicata GSE-PSE-MK54-09C]|jgi:omega-6 fatty acid desaturase (delta-12 desaturase)|nr:fatty acid desaturase [Kaiparowitsia implicata GSE-PSE-MK54-09C]